MPMCSYPLGCENFAIKLVNMQSSRCAIHQVNTPQLQKAEEAFVSKHKLDEEARIAREKLQAERDKLAAAAAAKQLARSTKRAEIIELYVPKWSALINDVVRQVNDLRATVPTANAGKNGKNPVIPGGLENEIVLTISGTDAAYGVKAGDVCRRIAGFDVSDSGVVKFRRASNAGDRTNILIHCR